MNLQKVWSVGMKRYLNECNRLFIITEENKLFEWPQKKIDVNILQKCLEKDKTCKILFYSSSKFINFCTNL